MCSYQRLVCSFNFFPNDFHHVSTLFWDEYHPFFSLCLSVEPPHDQFSPVFPSTRCISARHRARKTIKGNVFVEMVPSQSGREERTNYSGDIII